jgi:hypothetical protein
MSNRPSYPEKIKIFPLPLREGMKGRGTRLNHPHPNPPPSRGRD